MVEKVKTSWSTLCVKWKAMTFWQKFIFANVVYPWGPTLVYIGYRMDPPDEVKVLVKENGETLYQVVGTAWEIACHMFVVAAGNLF